MNNTVSKPPKGTKKLQIEAGSMYDLLNNDEPVGFDIWVYWGWYCSQSLAINLCYTGQWGFSWKRDHIEKDIIIRLFKTEIVYFGRQYLQEQAWQYQ